MSFRGVDISEYQHPVNYAALAQDVDFVMIRTGYGRHAKQKDHRLEEHVKGCVAAGIPFGFYHYSYADTPTKAAAEATFMLSLIKLLGVKPEYPLAFDFEDASLRKLTPKESRDVCVAFCETIKAAGYYPCIYASLAWWKNKLFDVDLLKYDAWVAQWNQTCDYTGDNKGMWQYTSSGAADGISGRVDCNYAYHNYPELMHSNGYNGFTATHFPVPLPEATDKATQVYPKASDVLVVKDSKVICGGVEIPALIINGIMYSPLRETVATIGSSQMGVVWNNEEFNAKIELGDED